MSKCPYCGKTPYPMFDENKKIIWRNILRIDGMMLVIIICLLFSAWAYKHDTEKCAELLKDPCDYASKFECKNFVIIEKTGDKNESQLSPYTFNPKVS